MRKASVRLSGRISFAAVGDAQQKPPKAPFKLSWNLEVWSIAVGQNHCRDCELLRDFYWLKVNRFLLTLRPVSAPHSGRHNNHTNVEQGIESGEIQAAKAEALRAMCALVSHLKACYAIDRLRADASRIDRSAHCVGIGGSGRSTS